MEQINGFFRLLHAEDGTYIRLTPPIHGGQRIQIDEITEYLSSKRIFDYNRTLITNAMYNQGSSTVDVKLLNQKSLPEQETMKVKVHEDGKYAVARFYPPSNDGAYMTKEDIVSACVSAGIKYGLLEDVVQEFMDNRIYCTDIVIAEAMLPTEGHDASIEYRFNTNVTRKHKMNQDGTVDFHQLDLINHVEAGDILAVLNPVDYGKPGLTVTGKIIKPKSVHNKILKHSNKTHLTEDGLMLISDVSGHVTIIDEKVIVSDTYDINSDIDMSTGDVEYSGSVVIKGNVLTGFTVRATGSITVEGVVEGATLISDSDIILHRGIQGMNKGKLVAKGDIVAKFIENAVIECDGNVTAEAILHSKIYAGHDISVTGNKGYVTGGELHSGTLIEVKSAGSTMGTHTLLEVGVDPKAVIEFHEKEEEIEKCQKELYKVDQILDLFQKKFNGAVPSDKLSTYLLAKGTHEKYTKELREAQERYDVLQNVIEQNDSGSVIVEKIIYSGCKIIISGVTYYVREELFAKKFVKEDVDIKVIDHFY